MKKKSDNILWGVFAVVFIKLRNTISKTTKSWHSSSTPNSSWINFLEKLFVIDKPFTVANNMPNAVFLRKTPYVWAADNSVWIAF